MSERMWTLGELDALHTEVGLGELWRTSDARREIAERITVPGEVVHEIAVISNPARGGGVMGEAEPTGHK